MAGEKKYSYIRKSFARNGFYSLGLALLSLLTFGGVFFLAVSGMGESSLSAAAVGLFSMVMALMGLWFMGLSFREPDKNRLLAKIGGGLSGLLLLVWIGVLAVGLTR